MKLIDIPQGHVEMTVCFSHWYYGATFRDLLFTWRDFDDENDNAFDEMICEYADKNYIPYDKIEITAFWIIGDDVIIKKWEI